MGQLLSIVYDPACAVSLNLVDPQLSEGDSAERELHNRVSGLMQLAANNLKAIRDYESNAELLRVAMSSSKDEALQQKAFSSLLPKVDVIKGFYDLSKRLEVEVAALLSFLAGKDLTQHQAVVKLLADVLDFVLTFDYEKMMKPVLQNDFSYYRRNFPKMSYLPGVQVGEAEAGVISMFIAQNLPMTVTVVGAVKGLLKAGGEQGLAVLDVISVLANATADMALRAELQDEPKRYALRVMTSALVLYDRVTPTGVFVQSSVHTRKCLRTLQRAQGSTASLAQQLTNSVKYSTLHYKDGSTPGYVRALLGE